MQEFNLHIPETLATKGNCQTKNPETSNLIDFKWRRGAADLVRLTVSITPSGAPMLTM